MVLVVVLLAILAGALAPLQSANAELFKFWQQPLWTVGWVYLSGLSGVLLLQLLFRQAVPATQAVHAAPWWAWMGGIASIATTIISLMYAQKLGSGMFTGLTLTASIIVSIVLDQMGWLGFKQHAASPLRIAGGALMVGGVWLVSKF